MRVTCSGSGMSGLTKESRQSVDGFAFADCRQVRVDQRGLQGAVTQVLAAERPGGRRDDAPEERPERAERAGASESNQPNGDTLL